MLKHVLQTIADSAGSPELFLYPNELHFRSLLEKLPAGAYACDADGLITFFNRQAVRIWGREPKVNDPGDRYCGSFRLFAPDGSPLSHNQCWMALALRDQREYNGREIMIERPDGHRVTALAHARPIHDEFGQLLGAVNVLVDIRECKRAEEKLALRARQQAAVAASTLNLPHCGIWDLRPGALGEEPERCALPPEGPAGAPPLQPPSLGRFALRQPEQPIIFEDLAHESRFAPPARWRQAGIQSGAAC